jgi:DNA mismatch repair ATPase MutS
MDALGTVEALSALATLASDHPDWAFPELADAGPPPQFQAAALGHPLLAEGACVRNDVEVGPPGRVLLITGSNMSGKSTLLRSVGLAVVLADAGGPVCVRSLRLPVCTLFTSMRVQDSIEAGVSFFMAELERLAALLRAAPARGDSGPPLLYLVDEILQGTNSDERRVAGRRLIRHLLRRNAIGAVTTHDLELHRHPEVEAASELVHFRESVTGDAGAESLSFDYRLREGLAETRNALRLAEIVGLSDPDVVGLSE